VRLDQVASGGVFTLRRISEEAEEDTVLIRYLQNSHLVPGERFAIIDCSPVYGVTLQRDDRQITLSPQIAAYLWGDVTAT
jgi:DtxR family Mn-dependent transcriptional regulator